MKHASKWMGMSVLLMALVLGQSCKKSSNPSAPAAPTATFTATAVPPCANASNTPCTSTYTATSTSTPTGTATCTKTTTPSPTSSDTPTSTATPTDTATITSTPTATTCANHGLTDSIGFTGGLSAGAYYTNQWTVSTSTYVDSLNVFLIDNSAETLYLALYDSSTGNQISYGSFVSGSGAETYTVAITPVSLPAGSYNLVFCVPTGSTHAALSWSAGAAKFDIGTYNGGVPPANYSSFSTGTGGFNMGGANSGNTLYFHGCP